MLHIKVLGNLQSGLGEVDSLRFLIYMSMVAILVM